MTQNVSRVGDVKFIGVTGEGVFGINVGSGVGTVGLLEGALLAVRVGPKLTLGATEGSVDGPKVGP